MMMKATKWYQGWRNIITIVSFLLPLWPVPALIMWILADWGRRAKWVVTIVYILPIFGLIAGLFHPQMFQDIESGGFFAAKSASLGLITIGIAIAIAFVLTLLRNVIKKSLSEIWIPTIIFMVIIFSIITFLLIGYTQFSYNLL